MCELVNVRIVMEDKSNLIAHNVDEYLNGLPEDIRYMLEEIRVVIKETAPMAEEVISYKVPTYKYHGPLVHLFVSGDHCSFTFVSKSILDWFDEELKNYKISGRTIHFTVEKPLSKELVRKIVKFRVRENEERRKK